MGLAGLGHKVQFTLRSTSFCLDNVFVGSVNSAAVIQLKVLRISRDFLKNEEYYKRCKRKFWLTIGKLLLLLLKTLPFVVAQGF